MEYQASTIRVGMVGVNRDERDFHRTGFEVRKATDREAAWVRRQIGLDPHPILGETRH